MVTTEIDDAGNKKKTHVLLGGSGSEIAAQIVYPTVSLDIGARPAKLTILFKIETIFASMTRKPGGVRLRSKNH